MTPEEKRRRLDTIRQRAELMRNAAAVDLVLEDDETEEQEPLDLVDLMELGIIEPREHDDG